MFLTIVISAIIVLGIIAALAQRSSVGSDVKEGKTDISLETKSEVSKTESAGGGIECCGQHEVCEKDSLLAAVSRDIVYYDDEELDRFRGRTAYNEEETEEFRDVLYTMRSDEVAGWVRSLLLRQIELPEGLKDEVFLIVGDRRQ